MRRLDQVDFRNRPILIANEIVGNLANGALVNICGPHIAVFPSAE
jgi:hypothetical protein